MDRGSVADLRLERRQRPRQQTANRVDRIEQHQGGDTGELPLSTHSRLTPLQAGGRMSDHRSPGRVPNEHPRVRRPDSDSARLRQTDLDSARDRDARRG